MKPKKGDYKIERTYRNLFSYELSEHMINAQLNWFNKDNSISSAKNIEISVLNESTEEVYKEIVNALEERNADGQIEDKDRILGFRGVGLVTKNTYPMNTPKIVLNNHNETNKTIILNNTIADLAILSIKLNTTREENIIWDRKMVKMNRLLKELETVGVFMIRENGEIINDFESYKQAIAAVENPIYGVIHNYTRNAKFDKEESKTRVRSRY